MVYSPNSLTLRGSREKPGLSALQKVNIYESVSRGLDDWGRWQKSLGPSISKSLFSLRTLWVIIGSCYYKLYDINSLAHIQILMDEVQILKKSSYGWDSYWQSQRRQQELRVQRNHYLLCGGELLSKEVKGLWNEWFLCNNWWNLGPNRQQGFQYHLTKSAKNSPYLLGLVPRDIDRLRVNYRRTRHLLSEIANAGWQSILLLSSPVLRKPSLDEVQEV